MACLLARRFRRGGYLRERRAKGKRAPRRPVAAPGGRTHFSTAPLVEASRGDAWASRGPAGTPSRGVLGAGALAVFFTQDARIEKADREARPLNAAAARQSFS